MSYFSTREAAEKLGISYESLRAIDYRPMFRNDKGYRWSGNDLRVIEIRFAKRLKRVRRARINYDKRKEVSDRIRQENLPEDVKCGQPAGENSAKTTPKEEAAVLACDKWRREQGIRHMRASQYYRFFNEYLG